jgi:thiamine pyrophosphokinase
MSRCIVVCAGEQGRWDFPAPDDFVIACDAGYDRALAMGLKADLLVGDFDSRSHADLPQDLAVLRFPVDKDDTDSLLAVKEGLARDTGILCCCARWAAGSATPWPIYKPWLLRYGAAAGPRLWAPGRGC